MTIIEILNYSKKVIENVTLGAVNRITGHKYDINNFPDTQKVKGKIEISNFPKQQKVLANFPTVQKVTGKVETDTKPFFKSIWNKLNEVVLALGKVLSVKVVNFPEPIKFPYSVKISNLPNQEKLDTKNIEIGLDGVIKAIKKLPTSFPEPKEIVFPKQEKIVIPRTITVDNLEGLKSDKPEEYIPVRLTDGKDFYEAFQSIVTGMRSFFTNSKGQKKDALVDDDRHLQVDVLTAPPSTITGFSTSDKQDDIINKIDGYSTNHIDDTTTTSVVYIGMEDKDGVSYIKKIDSTAFPVFTYASVINNPSLTTYTTLWAGRVTATFGTYSQAFN